MAGSGGLSAGGFQVRGERYEMKGGLEKRGLPRLIGKQTMVVVTAYGNG
jgi:hypothetical protein